MTMNDPTEERRGPAAIRFDAARDLLTELLSDTNSRIHAELIDQLQGYDFAKIEVERFLDEIQKLRDQIRNQTKALDLTQKNMNALELEHTVLQDSWHMPGPENNRNAIKQQIDLKKQELAQVRLAHASLSKKISNDKALISELDTNRKTHEANADALSKKLAARFSEIGDLYQFLDAFAIERVETLLDAKKKLQPIVVDKLKAQEPGLSDITRARLNDYDLEEKIQGILDHMTTLRITEEMDTHTYNNRMSSFFKRAAEQARVTHETRLLPLKELFEPDGVLTRALDQVDALDREMSAFVPVRKFKLLAALYRDTVNPKSNQVRNAINQFRSFIEQIESSLVRVHDGVCHPDLVARCKSHATWVSYTVEKGQLLRLWPFLLAVTATVLTLGVLSFDRSPFLVEYQLLVACVIFTVSYFWSLRLGIVQRAGFMSFIRDYLFEQFDTSLNPSLKLDEEKHSFRLRHQSVNKVARLTQSPVLMTNQLDTKGPKRRLDRKMFRQNMALCLIWATCALGYVYATGQFDPKSPFGAREFVARDASGSPCTYEYGYLVRATNDSYVMERNRQYWPISGKKRVTLERANIEALVAEDAPKTTPNCDEKNVLKVAVGQETESQFALSITDIASAISRLKLEQDISVSPQIMNGAGTSDIVTPILLQAFNTANAAGPLMFEHRVLLNDVAVFNQKNALLLSFFPDPVEAKDKPEDGLTDYWFNFGLTNNLKPPKSDEVFKDYLDQVLASLEEGLTNYPSSIVIDVQGFASETWEKEKSKPEDIKAWNYALAEGRRMAVLKRIKADLSPEILDRIYVRRADGSDLAIGDLDTEPQTLQGHDSRFTDFATMNQNLGCWTETKSDFGRAFEKVFQRSVVVIVDDRETPMRPKWPEGGCQTEDLTALVDKLNGQDKEE